MLKKEINQVVEKSYEQGILDFCKYLEDAFKRLQKPETNHLSFTAADIIDFIKEGKGKYLKQ